MDCLDSPRKGASPCRTGAAGKEWKANMPQTTSLLLLNRGMEKLYGRYMDDIRRDFSLSRIEITIISFLHNNPGLDTAADIAELRMLSKGNVSQGVESLIQNGYLERFPDLSDRRRIHLSLTAQSGDIISRIDEAKARFLEQLTKGLTPEELGQYQVLTEKIMKNVRDGLESRCDFNEQ